MTKRLSNESMEKILNGAAWKELAENLSGLSKLLKSLNIDLIGQALG